MSRPRVIEFGMTKAARLPGLLVEQLEAIAELKGGVSVSEVMRQILSQHVREFYDVYRKSYTAQITRMVDTLKSDDELYSLFLQFRDKDKWAIPAHIMDQPRRLNALSAALRNYKRMGRIDREFRELFPPCK